MLKTNKYIKIAEKISLLIRKSILKENLWEDCRKIKRENIDLGKKLFSKEVLEDKILRYNSLDTNIHYNNLRNRIVKDRNRKRVYTLMKYAAVVVPIVFTLGILCYNVEKSVNVRGEVNDIAPLGKKAILVLSSGEKLNLEDTLSKIPSDVKKICQKKTGNKLVYNGNQDKIVYHKIVVPRGGEYILELSDGTEVYLFSETELSYPSSFSGGIRKVRLSGEAYFKVKRDTANPFVVEAGDLNIKVLGTSFNVRAYNDEKEIETSLVKGKVKVKGVELRPNKQAVYSKIDKNIILRNIIGKHYKSRSKGMFVFYEQTLDDILRELARWYDFEYFYENKGLSDKRYVVNVPKYNSVKEIFDIIEKMKEVKFIVKDRNVIVRKI